jgi:hypothetical protein
VRPVPPGWGPAPGSGWGYYPPRRRRRPELGGVTVLVLVTALVWLAAPHVGSVRTMVAGGLPQLPSLQAPQLPQSPAAPDRGPVARAPKGLTFTDGAGCQPAGDWASPRLDRRVRALLVAAAGQYRVRVSCLRSGHSWFVKGTRRVSNHSVWRAVDLDQVDGRPVSTSNTAARRLAVWIGQGRAGVQPSEVGSPFELGRRPYFTDDGHQGHLHVGFPGPTRAGGW